MGALQNINDYARILSNGLSFGLADRIAAAPDGMTVAQEQAATAAARQRQGFAGDVANVGANLIGVGKAFSLGKGALAAVRAAPTAIPAAARAARVGLTNAYGPGMTAAEVASRLNIPYAPTLAERALGAAGRTVANTAAFPFRHPILSAVTGAGALAEYAGRNSNTRAAPVTQAAKPASQSAKSQQQVPQKPVVKPKSMLESLLTAAAAEQGGKVSLNQLNAIGDFVNRASPEIRHPPTYKDVAAQQLMAVDQQVWNQNQQQVQALKQAGRIDEAVALQQQGIAQRAQRMGVILGQDPYSMMALNPPQPGD